MVSKFWFYDIMKKTKNIKSFPSKMRIIYKLYTLAEIRTVYKVSKKQPVTKSNENSKRSAHKEFIPE